MYFASDTGLQELNAGFLYHRNQGSENTGSRISTRCLSVRHLHWAALAWVYRKGTAGLVLFRHIYRPYLKADKYREVGP